jgi:hypothetical protein
LRGTALPNARELGTWLTARLRIDPDAHTTMQHESSGNRTSEALDQDTTVATGAEAQTAEDEKKSGADSHPRHSSRQGGQDAPTLQLLQ